LLGTTLGKRLGVELGRKYGALLRLGLALGRRDGCPLGVRLGIELGACVAWQAGPVRGLVLIVQFDRANMLETIRAVEHVEPDVS
jgi:hypothetical protein